MEDPERTQKRKEELEQNKREKGGGRDFLRSLFPLSLSYNSSAFRTCRWKRERTERAREGKKLSLRRSPIHQRDLLQKCQLDIGLPRESKLLDTLYFVCWQIPAPPWRGRKMNYRRRSGSIPHGGGRDRKRPKPLVVH